MVNVFTEYNSLESVAFLHIERYTEDSRTVVGIVAADRMGVAFARQMLVEESM